MTGLIGKTPTTIGHVGSCESSTPMSPSRTRVAMNSDSRGGRPTKTVPWPHQLDRRDVVEVAVQLEARRSSCSGTYGRDLMKRRNCAAVGPLLAPRPPRRSASASLDFVRGLDAHQPRTT